MRLIIAFIAVVLVACSSANTKSTDQSFPISSYASVEKKAAADTVKHKSGDAEVFRITGKDTTYFTRMYRTQDGELRHYETTVPGSYDRASYQWMNDSTVSFKLINTKNNTSRVIQLMGSGATTTVQ